MSAPEEETVTTPPPQEPETEDGDEASSSKNNNDQTKRSSVTFAASLPTDHEESADGDDDDARKEEMERQRRRRSSRGSFFGMMGTIFGRAGGEDGADLDTMRGTTGPDFEANVIIYRDDTSANNVVLNLLTFGAFGGNLRKNKKNTTKEKYLLIKGPHCFVYEDKDDAAPMYALSLAQLTAGLKNEKQNQSSKKRYVMVTLKNALGDAEYTIGLADQEAADDFIATVRVQAAAGEADIARKELGHDDLVYKRSSMKYAEKVATMKTQKQPERKPEKASMLMMQSSATPEMDAMMSAGNVM